MARGRKAAAVPDGPVEGPWDLPEGWRWERIEAVAPVNPRRKFDHVPNDAEIAFVPMAAVQELNGEIDISEMRSVAAVQSGFSRFASGDVIFAKITPCMENGKLAVVPPVPHGMAAGSTEFHVLEPQGVSARYLFHFLSQAIFRDAAEHNMTGTAGQKRVPTDWLRNAPIPVPPNRDVEAAIVGRLDMLFDEVGDAEELVEEARVAAETYRRALLKAAVTGELTADWRAANAQAETGQALLTRILAERRARWEADPKNVRKRYVEPGGVDADELSELPKTWAVAGFNVVADALSEGGKKLKERDYAASGTYPVVDQGAKSIAGYTNDAALLQEHTGPLIVFGDHTRRFKFIDFPFCVGADGVKLIAPHPLMDARYLHLALTAAHFEDRGYSRHFQFVRALDLPVPPFEEQAFIVSRLTQAFDKLDSLEIAALRDHAADLRQSILAAAFRGDLVAEPQA